MNPRLNSLQLLRFIASFLVLITHSGFYVHERLDPSFEFWRRGASGVVLFFVISGFVIVISLQNSPSTIDWKTFTIKRLLRIVPIYWLATTAKVLVMVVAAGSVLHSNFDLVYIAKSYLFIPSYNPIDEKVQPLLGVGWTLVYEMLFYTMFAIALFLRLPPVLFAGLIMILLASGSVFKDGLLDMQNYPVSYFLLDGIVINFVFGMILGKLFINRVFLPTWISIISAVFGALTIVFELLDHIVWLPPEISIGLSSVLLIWGAFSLEVRHGFRALPQLLFLGEASYSTYLFHPLIVPLVPVMFLKLGLHNGYLATGVGVCVALAAASFVYVALERPITRFLAAKLVARTHNGNARAEALK
jgi:exopolysaccharide production protein ExoZ